jgi:hypothetical protein
MIAKSSLRLGRVDLAFAFQALRREFVEPGERNPERKPDPCSDQKPARRPFRCADRRAQLRDALCERPDRADVEDRSADDVAPLQFGEKVSAIHLAAAAADSFGAREATIFSKRGSPRSGSQKGNSLSMP